MPVATRFTPRSLLTLVVSLFACTDHRSIAAQDRSAATPEARRAGPPLDVPTNGQFIFRHWTFGDEPFWTDTLHLNEVVETGVSPATALAVGLKVDAEKLPPGLLASADLASPATTVELLRLHAIVGLEGQVSASKHLTRLGITCALCHSTVDNSVAKGIGRRLDGWPNGDLNVGAIVALSPALPATVKAVYNSWGPGKYDAEFNRDGINSPVVLPAAFGLRGVALETYTGEGPISYWNAYVAVTQMHGHGSFSDPALGISIVQTPDLVTPVLPALRDYQLSLRTPPPPPGSFDAAAAIRGRGVFAGTARCASCHIPSMAFTDVNRGILHAPSETGMDPVRAGRLKNHKYRTTPLRALWQHAPYFHDGSAATLAGVVEHYDRFFKLGLSPRQKGDLVEYLKSLPGGRDDDQDHRDQD